MRDIFKQINLKFEFKTVFRKNSNSQYIKIKKLILVIISFCINKKVKQIIVIESK